MVETVKGFQRMLLVTVTQALVGDAREDANERLEPKTLSGAIRILTKLLMSIDKMGGWVGWGDMGGTGESGRFDFVRRYRRPNGIFYICMIDSRRSVF